MNALWKVVKGLGVGLQPDLSWPVGTFHVVVGMHTLPGSELSGGWACLLLSSPCVVAVLDMFHLTVPSRLSNGKYLAFLRY